MSVPLKTVLVVEDDEATLEVESRVLRRMGIKVVWASTCADAIVALNRERFSLVLLDYKLPDGPSWPVLDAAQNALIRVPVIMVTGMGDEGVAAEAIHRGAVDYVVKTGDFWENLPLLILLAIKRSESDQRKAHLASIVELSPDAIISMSLTGKIQSWNAAAQSIYGFTMENLESSVAILTQLENSVDLPEILARFNAGESTANMETARVDKDGRQIPLMITVSPLRDERGTLIGLSMIVCDLTERNARRAEERAKQAKAQLLANI